MISVVIPAYNEQDAIGETVTAVRDTLTASGHSGFEIVVVDDGSKDETSKRATEAGARVVRHPHNAGYGRSLKDGIAAAQHEIIVICDADGTYPTDRIPDLLERYSEGFDMVVGARRGEHYRQSFIKMPLRLVLRKMVEFTAGRTIPDINSGLRVFRRATAMRFYDHLCDTFSFTTSMTLAYMMTGLYVAYLDIDYNERIGKSKVRLFSDSMKTLQYVFEAAIYYNPLRIFILMTQIVIGLSFLSFALAMLLKLSVFFFIGVGGIISAIIVFSIGLLAVLLRQIMIKAAPPGDWDAPIARGGDARD